MKGGEVQAPQRYVYVFGAGEADGTAEMSDILGGKGANLAEMASLGLPVPPGFTLTTEVCQYFSRHRSVPDDLEDEVRKAMTSLEAMTGRRFGAAQHSLLLSVRSGARASMPGMMDTILNLGMNDLAVEALAEETGDGRFAWDSYRRFIQMYSDTVLRLDLEFFEEILEEEREKRGRSEDMEMTADDWKAVVARYLEFIEEELGEPFPQDVEIQLRGAIRAVLGSWMNPRAIAFRALHGLQEQEGTAVNIQAMVFGNRDDRSATGVCFTREPNTGEKTLYGEYLPRAQGEDVVSGLRTPLPLSAQQAHGHSGNGAECSMEVAFPDAYAELKAVAGRLEAHYGDMQDIEFTIESGQLYILQTRAAKRSAGAALRIAVEMADAGLIDRDDALLRIDPLSLVSLLHASIDPNAERDEIARGLPAAPGAACGQIVFSPDEAAELAERGKKIILVRTETSPEDIHGMSAAEGILTTRGGTTSHAAVVARGMGKPCVSGAGTLRVDYAAKTLSTMGRTFSEGDLITIDGTSGEVFAGGMTMRKPQLSEDFQTILQWADAARRMKVRTNIDVAGDADLARDFGAEGIGLCRTEHMFFEDGRILAMRQLILAETDRDRESALLTLLPSQRDDFIELFEQMAGFPVTIRLLDPPFHEFLPQSDEELQETADLLNVPVEKIEFRAETLLETNPMLGHRGVRVAISYPAIPEMQVRAIFEAAVEAGRRTGRQVKPEIMLPLVSLQREVDFVREIIDRVGREVMKETGASVEYTVGILIELPRAAVRARLIAESCDFFSFGTNDLTQTVFGISRDDAAQFLETYRQAGIVEANPFITLDVEGVGEMIKIACEKGRSVKADLMTGICGEHAGDPKSIEFCEQTGLDYVSCSPFRVPIARLAAAQAALRLKEQKTTES
ncbi:pyruvate, phosphate dikinase [Notoacmeibacter ruber]|uniref:Pyruvate, phosphate dikinase n=1 Tax=Notoacmeibacter ruber TaxID=2670375 RepID=A0A3L7JG66_9HYPH|nr:pyruvate, phosphate dikinase [Notoacmeibacter ruber]RLQ87472.1 pyruvate, phosphate dikinase [Notoacmeibacter ruber]